MKIKINISYFSCKFILVWLMLCICFCHSKSFVPGVIVGTLQLFYVFFYGLFCKKHNESIPKRNMVPFVWNCCFILLCIVSIVWAEDTNLVFQIVPQLYMRFCLVLFIAVLYKSKKDIEYGILAYLFACGYMMLKMLIYMFMHPANYFDNVTFYTVCEEACGVNFNQVAQILAIGIIFSVLWFSQNKKVCILYIIMSMMFIFMTGSRKGFLIPVIGLVVFYYLRDFNRLKKQFRNIVIFALAAVLIAFFFAKNPVYLDRLKIAFQAVFLGKTGDLSSRERLYFSSLACEMFFEKPLLGWGANNFRGVLASSGYSNVVYCHNNYLEIASGLGIVGVVVNYWFYIPSLLKNIIKVKKAPSLALTISIFSVFLVFEYGIVTYLFPAYIYILVIAYYYAVYERKD